jgi:glycosyltransferase involved in cell wall biosynthesis
MAEPTKSGRPGSVIHVLWNMNIGGAERALYQLVREQRARGIAADILIGSSAGFYGAKAREETGATVTELGQTSAFDMSIRDRMREIIREYPIIHFHSAELGLIHVAAGVPGLRRYYTHRAGMFDYALKQLVRYKITGRYIRRHFHGISGNTAQACEAAAKLFGISRDVIPVTYNGIDFDLLEPSRPPGELLDEHGDTRKGVIRIGTSANLRTLKRIDLLIDAVHRLAGRDIHCYILGDGPARPGLEEQVRRLGLERRVTFTGKKERVGDYLQILDIFVLPSGPEESFGNSAVEAMGFGLPTIVFADGGGLVEHVDDGTTGFIVKDLDHLVATIGRLIDDPDLRARIGRTARQTMRARYTGERMVERYNLLYACNRIDPGTQPSSTP